jgi:glucokinase
MHLHQKLDHLPTLLAASDLNLITATSGRVATKAQTQSKRKPITPLVVGVDLGGTQTRAAVVRQDEIIARTSHPTPATEGPAAVIAGIAAAIHEVMAMAETGLSEIAGIGVSAPGPLNSRTGVVYEAPNLHGWKDIPLGEDLAKLFNGQVPVFLGHDANLAGLAEFRFGSGRGSRDMIYMTVSTGIGGGVILGDVLIEGSIGTAGEIGHMYIDMRPDGPRDGIGHIGCLEAFASGTALARDANALVAAGGGHGMLAAHQIWLSEHPSTSPEETSVQENLTARDVVAAAQEGDPEALQLLNAAGVALGFGCTNLIHILNPDCIVIGGGVTNAGPLLFEPILKTVQQRAFQRPAEMVRIIPAQLGDDGGLIGAAAYVEYRQLHDPEVSQP